MKYISGIMKDWWTPKACSHDWKKFILLRCITLSWQPGGSSSGKEMVVNAFVEEQHHCCGHSPTRARSGGGVSSASDVSGVKREVR